MSPEGGYQTFTKLGIYLDFCVKTEVVFLERI